MKAQDAKPGDRVRVGGNVDALPPLVVTVIAGTPAEPHLIPTDWGHFADYLCEPSTPAHEPQPFSELRTATEAQRILDAARAAE